MLRCRSVLRQPTRGWGVKAVASQLAQASDKAHTSTRPAPTLATVMTSYGLRTRAATGYGGQVGLRGTLQASLLDLMDGLIIVEHSERPQAMANRPKPVPVGGKRLRVAMDQRRDQSR